MAKNQVSISTVGDMKPALEKAKTLFPDAGSEAELFRRIVLDWYKDKQEDRIGNIDNKISQIIELLKTDGKRPASVTAPTGQGGTTKTTR